MNSSGMNGADADRKTSALWMFIGLGLFNILAVENFSQLASRQSPLLDLLLLVEAIPTVALFFLYKAPNITAKISFMLGWLHACALAYLAVAAFSLSRLLFFTALAINLFHGPAFLGESIPYGSLQQVICSMQRGVMVELLVSAATFFCGRKLRLTLPAYSTVILVSMTLWLSAMIVGI